MTGGVMVPAGLERRVARLLVAGLNALTRAAGGARVDPELQAWLNELNAADVRSRRPVSATGPVQGVARSFDMSVPVSKAAELSGYSPRHIRRLCQRGDLESQRLSDRVLLVSLNSLHAHRAGQSTAPSTHLYEEEPHEHED